MVINKEPHVRPSRCKALTVKCLRLLISAKQARKGISLSPEWVRRTICCALWGTEHADTAHACHALLECTARTNHNSPRSRATGPTCNVMSRTVSWSRSPWNSRNDVQSNRAHRLDSGVQPAAIPPYTRHGVISGLSAQPSICFLVSL